MYKRFIKLSTWKIFLFVFVVIIFAFVSWSFYATITDEPPHFFPLDDPKAEYRIIKSCPATQGWGKRSTNSRGYLYCVEYKGENVLMKEENRNTEFFTITIGKSMIALEPYIGKKVTNIKGKFVSSSKQCIQKECVDIKGPHVVLNIDRLELVK